MKNQQILSGRFEMSNRQFHVRFEVKMINLSITNRLMEAIRRIMTVRDNTLKVTLPDNFNDKVVELIILPADGPMQVQEPEADYFTQFYGSIKSDITEAELDKKLKSLRDEWNRDIS